jgi:hypothetical protein
VGSYSEDYTKDQKRKASLECEIFSCSCVFPVKNELNPMKFLRSKEALNTVVYTLSGTFGKSKIEEFLTMDYKRCSRSLPKSERI